MLLKYRQCGLCTVSAQFSGKHACVQSAVCRRLVQLQGFDSYLHFNRSCLSYDPNDKFYFRESQTTSPLNCVTYKLVFTRQLRIRLTHSTVGLTRSVTLLRRKQDAKSQIERLMVSRVANHINSKDKALNQRLND